MMSYSKFYSSAPTGNGLITKHIGNIFFFFSGMGEQIADKDKANCRQKLQVEDLFC